MIQTGIAFVVDASGAKIGTAEVTRELDKIPAAADRAQSKLTGAFGKAKGSLDKVASSIFNIQNAATAGGFTVLVKNITETGKRVQNLRIAFESIYGSMVKANAEFDFVTKTANRLGIGIEDLARGYLKFSAATKNTKLEGQATREIFEKTAASMRVLGRSSADTEGVLNAFAQMVSKGRVQAEELRGQLGDRLFGSFNRAALAIGVTTEKLEELMKEGQVKPDTFLLQFVNQLSKDFPVTEKALSSFDATYTRFQNKLLLMKEKSFNSGLEDSLRKVIDQLSVSMDKIDVKKFTESLATGIRGAGEAFIFLVDNASTVLTIFKAYIALKIVTLFVEVGTAVFTVGRALLALAAVNPFVALAAAVVLIIGYLATFTDRLDGLKRAGVAVANALKAAFDGLATGISNMINRVDVLLNKIGTGLKKGLAGPAKAANTGGLVIAPAFAGGGIMSSSGPVPLKKYAGGGIANSPQLALFGEGSTPEAYVPVPNGRIPVELKGRGGNYIINNNVFNSSSTASAFEGFDISSKFLTTDSDFSKKLDKSELFEKSKNALDRYVESVDKGMDAVYKIADNGVQKLEDTFVDFFKTGKLNFKDFFSSIQDDILRSFVQQSITAPIAQGLSGLFSGGGGGGGLFSSILSSSGGGGSGAGIFGEIASFAGSFFANGGIMSSSGPLPLRKYSMGGVASSPQLAMFGEGSQNEAFVPLPDGRSIPVVQRGGSKTSSIVVNMTVVAKDADSFNQSRGQIAGSLAVELARQKSRFT